MDLSSTAITGAVAVSINDQGEVTVPERLRDRLHLRPGAALLLLPFGEGLLLLPEQTRLEAVLGRIRDRLAETGHTPEEIMATLPDSRADVYRHLYGEPGDDTEYLLSSPANRERLLRAVTDVESNRDLGVSDPWCRYAGMWKEMPDEDWDAYQQAIEDYQRELAEDNTVV